MLKCKNILCLIILMTIYYSKAELRNEVSKLDAIKTKEEQPCTMSSNLMTCRNGLIKNFANDFNNACGTNNPNCVVVSLSISGYEGPENKVIPKDWFSKINISTSINFMNFAYNDFEVIEDDAFNSMHFRITHSLFLTHLKVQRLTKYMFNGLTAVTDVYLTGNPIKEIEENTFYSMRYTLNKLFIEESTRPFSLQNLTGSAALSLKIFNMNGNSFENFIDENSFRGVVGLQMLNMASSKITSLPDQTFDHFNGNLKTLWISGNLLTTISRRAFLFLLENDVKVSLARNPWICDCNLLEFKNLLQRSPNNFEDVPLCDSPAAFKGKPIVDSNFCNKNDKASLS